MRKAALALTAAGFLLVGLTHAADDDKELAKLKGKWDITSVERDGKAMDTFKDGARDIDGAKYTMTSKAGAKFIGAFKIDPSKKPKVMDLMPEDGQYKGKTLLGIYELDGDTLKICFAEPGKDRPTEFSSKNGCVLAIHKRAK
jgi:uncharacterized protein (TIGR03067 family)